MNTFRKVGDAWCVMTETKFEPGTTVAVNLRDGRSKTVTLGEQVGSYQDNFIYAVAQAAKSASTQVGDLSGVLALFAKAKEHLKHPAVVLSVPGVAGLAIRLSVAGPRARVPGSITVLDAEKGIDGRDWFGRILTDGTYQPSNSANGRTEAITARLREFASDPAKVAAEHGKLTGNCCFCNRGLQDERSTAVGYGPVCAVHYGLPWSHADVEAANAAKAEAVERSMQKAEAEGDREQTVRDEQAKHEARSKQEDWTASYGSTPVSKFKFGAFYG